MMGSHVKFRALGILLTILSIYLVKMQIPAPAYAAGVVFILLFLLNFHRRTFGLLHILYLYSFIFFIALIALNAENFSEITIAFIVNLLLSLIISAYLISIRRLTYLFITAKVVFQIFIIVAIFDTVYKFVYPIPVDLSMSMDGGFFERQFYMYKGSFFYKDSNGLAYLLLPILALGYELHRGTADNYKKLSAKLYYVILPIFLIACTFSRAAVVAIVAILIMMAPRKFTIIAMVFIVWAAAISFGLFEYLINDASGGTKISEIGSIYTFISKSTITEAIIGVGFGAGDEITGRYIHGVVQKILLELGFFGLFLYVTMICSLLALGGTRIAIVGLLVMGASSNFYFLPPFAVAVIILIHCLYMFRQKAISGVNTSR